MVDMQLYLVSPLILVLLLVCNKRRALIAVGVLISVGIIGSFAAKYFMDQPPGHTSGG
jgi:peptidoglycan/LPS O-acetylase OafA/YrhL